MIRTIKKSDQQITKTFEVASKSPVIQRLDAATYTEA